MSHRHSPYRRWLVILLIALLSPIMPGKMNLCLLPDGGMHLEADCAAPCSLAAAQAVQPGGEHTDSFRRLNDGDGACRDFTIGENAARQQTRNLSPPAAPGLLILPRPGGLFPAGQPLIFEKQPAPSPHLKSQLTTVLRI